MTTTDDVPDLRMTIVPRLTVDANGDPTTALTPTPRGEPFSGKLLNALHAHGYRPFIDSYSRTEPLRNAQLYASTPHRALQFVGNTVLVWEYTERPPPGVAPSAAQVRAASWVPDLVIYYNTTNPAALSHHLWHQVLSYFCDLLKPVINSEIQIKPDSELCILDYGKTPGTTAASEVIVPFTHRTTRHLFRWIKPPVVCELIPFDGCWPDLTASPEPISATPEV